ncbi:DUF5336 domain-containing protein [Gordonia sp. FQ]|uniref:DUF5336 domain-containing protein n=1 Tax=Gordonia sp. FQ TaxID=3446634 RepID=UPI003F85F130
MTENPNYGPQAGPTQWGPAPQDPPPTVAGPYPPSGPYGPPATGPYGPPTGPYTGPPTQYGPPAGQPPAPNFFTQLPLPYKLSLGSAVFGVLTYIMGFLSWVTIDDSIEQKASRWADDNSNQVGIPAFLTMVFTPGYFLLFLGAAGVASFAFLVPKWRRYLPHVAALVVLAWLGLLACALGLPSFISLGAGAIVSLVLGSLQLALIGAAVIVDGRSES